MHGYKHRGRGREEERERWRGSEVTLNDSQQSEKPLALSLSPFPPLSLYDLPPIFSSNPFFVDFLIELEIYYLFWSSDRCIDIREIKRRSRRSTHTHTHTLWVKVKNNGRPIIIIIILLL